MKYPNFVGKQTIAFSQSEAENVFAVITKQYIEFFGKEFFKSVTYKVDCDEKYNRHSMTISMEFAVPQNGRNRFGSMIRNVSAFTIIVWKHTGYLEIKVGNDIKDWIHDYDNAPAYDYSASMSIVGEEREYRRKTWEYPHPGRCVYNYGTQAEDLLHDVKRLEHLRDVIIPVRKK